MNDHLCIMPTPMYIAHAANGHAARSCRCQTGATYTIIMHLLGGQRKAPLLQGGSCNMAFRLGFRCSVACVLQIPLPHFVFLMRDDEKFRHVLKAMSFQSHTLLHDTANHAHGI